MSRLVGRDDELMALVGALDNLSSGQSSWVQVTGEPGIGKTRLVGELRQLAEERGALVLVGRGAELEMDIPFGVVIDAFDDHLGSLDISRRVELCGRHMGELRRIFPILDAHGRGRKHRASEDGRYPTHRALRLLVSRLADPAPLVLVFDDLHWADSASIELISFLLGHPPDAAVLMVLCWRPGEAPGLAGDLTARARDLPRAAVGLTSLSEDSLAVMLGGDLDGPTLRSVYRASGGNPFYAEALFAVGGRSGPLERFGPTKKVEDGTIPDLVAAAVGHEISSVSESARLLAQGGAVLGGPFDVEVAARCAAIAPHRVAGGLDELLQRGIVRQARSSRRFAFRHPIVRYAVYESAGLGWRTDAHARAAAELLKRGAPIATTAHHLARSAPQGDLAAAELLIEAAVEVAAHAPASAKAWLDAAYAIVPHRADTVAVRIDLLAARARVACVLGDLHAGRDAFVEVLALVGPDDHRYVSLVAGCAGVEHGLGHFVEARSKLQGALEGAAAVNPVGEATLCIELAVSWLYTLDVVKAEAFAARASHVAAGRDRLLEGTARALLAFVHASAESPDGNRAASVHDTEAAVILDGLDDDEVTARLDALYYLGWAERLLERYGASSAHLGRAITVAEAGGGSQWLLPTLIEQAKVATLTGQLSVAVDVAKTAVEMAKMSGIRLLVLLALTAEAAALSAAGETARAIATCAEASSFADSGTSYHGAALRRVLALAYLEGGDDGRFLAEIASVDDTNVRDGVACRLLEARCRGELAIGRIGEARRLADKAHELAITLDLPASSGFAARARALVLASSEPGPALAAAREGIAAFDAAGSLVEGARTRILAAELLASCGRGDEAIAECSAAEDALSACGAQGVARQAHRLLRRLRRAGGASAPRREVANGATALSRREREIAELVAQGRTNRQIATRLSISENTVESHVGAILAKLDVSGRGAVARALANNIESGALPGDRQP